MTKSWQIDDGDLVPDDVQTELIMIRSRLTADYFRIGDIANRLVLEAAKTGMRVAAARIHKAVGRFVGKRPRTVRYYAENAAFFDSDARCLYQFLPFSFFDFARSFGNQWEEVLKVAADNPACTLGWLQNNYRLHDDSVEDKISEDSLPSNQGPSYSGQTLGNSRISFQCAKNHLIANPDGTVDIPYLKKVGISPQVGITSAEFHFVQEVSHLLERAEIALEISRMDTRIPENVHDGINYHLGALRDHLQKFAYHMDQPILEQMHKRKMVDIVG